jgi:hypothetical protein
MNKIIKIRMSNKNRQASNKQAKNPVIFKLKLSEAGLTGFKDEQDYENIKRQYNRSNRKNPVIL